MSRTVMMIHGAWLTPASFDRFRERYEARGFACLAPPWPYMDRPIDQLRKDPDPRLARVTIGEIVDHYAAIVNTLPEPPILMGHSFGGLFVQLLLDRGLGAAGVAIDPGTPRGVLPGMDTMLSSMPVLLAWNGWNRVLTMQFETFASRFAQRLSPAEMRAAYDQYIVPAPGRLYWQAAAGMGNALNYANPSRPPLLLIAGDEDRTIQPSMVDAAYRKHRKSPSLTEIEHFPGRTHWILNEPGWEEVADRAIEWATRSTTFVLPAT